MKRAPTTRSKDDEPILNRPKVALFCSVKPLYTFDHPANAALIEANARPVHQLDMAALKRGTT